MDETLNKRPYQKGFPKKCLEAASKWHSSEEGREFHKCKAIQLNFGIYHPLPFTCIQCSRRKMSKAVFEPKFCSKLCKGRFYQNDESKKEIRECVVCKMWFKIYKWRAKKCCSKECRSKLISGVISRRQTRLIGISPVAAVLNSNN